MKRKAKIAIGVVAVAAVGVAYGVTVFREKLTVSLPEYSPIQKSVWLDQNWSAKDRDWYHHANQGTLTFGIPYEWFVALEQPALSVSRPVSSAIRHIWTATVSYQTALKPNAT